MILVIHLGMVKIDISLAIATNGLNSPEAFTGVVRPLVEVHALIILVDVALRLKRYFK